MQQNSLSQVRKALTQHVGSRVLIKANKGRHKVDITEGVIAETHPFIFLVQVDNEVDEGPRTVSYSYSDVLTKDVRLSLCN